MNNDVKIIFAGSDLKFRITSMRSDLKLSERDFTIVIKNRWGQAKHTITKDDCFFDEDGNFYFNVESVSHGMYFAYFTGGYSDEDYIKQYRTITDFQYLCTIVGDNNNAKICPAVQTPYQHVCDDSVHCVKYEQIWTVSIDGADYLADVDGNYVYTSDGKRVQFINQASQNNDDMGKVKLNMTGDEFKTLIEGEKPNGVIDTIPEMKRAMDGISDEETVKDEVDEQIDEGLQQNKATKSDIDEIFNK